MKAPLILCAESAAAGHFLDLLFSVPEYANLRADAAAIACCTFQVKRDPLIAGGNRILVQESRSLLIRDHRIQPAMVAEIGQRDGSAVIYIGYTRELAYFGKVACAVVDPDLLLLIAGK